MRRRTVGKPWFVRYRGRGRWQIKPYGTGGWLTFLAWMAAMYGGAALLFLRSVRERPWIVGLIWLAACALVLAVGLRTSVPEEELEGDRRDR